MTAAESAPLRVIVVDDAVLFREGLARVLKEAGFEVTAQLGDAAALLDRVRAEPPDVVVVDIRMPPTHTTEGLDAARDAPAPAHPDLGILVLSAHVEPHYALQLIETGARGAGYLLKERVADLDELTDAVRRVAAGGLVIDPSVVAQLVGRRRARNPVETLTEREREVLAVMAEGRSNQAICQRLHLSPKTVEAYVRSVFTKLGCTRATTTTGGCWRCWRSCAAEPRRPVSIRSRRCHRQVRLLAVLQPVPPGRLVQHLQTHLPGRSW